LIDIHGMAPFNGIIIFWSNASVRYINPAYYIDCLRVIVKDNKIEYET